MAIKLEFFDIIIPIKTIEKKYPGGWTQCLKEHNGSIGGKVWYDDHLFRDGAMSPNDIGHLVDWWSEKGFDAQHFIDGFSSHLRDLMVSKNSQTHVLLEQNSSISKKYIGLHMAVKIGS